MTWRDGIARTRCAGRCLLEGTASVTHVEGALGQTHLYYVLRTRVNNAHRDVGGRRSLTITILGFIGTNNALLDVAARAISPVPGVLVYMARDNSE